MQSLNASRENRATFRARLVTNGDDVVVALSGGDNIRHTSGSVAADVDAEFSHRLHDKGIEPAWLNAGALGGEFPAAQTVHESLGHLAASAVVDADKENLLFHTKAEIQAPTMAFGAQQQPFGWTQWQPITASKAPATGAAR